MNENKKYLCLGCIFLLVQFIAIIRNYASSYPHFYWFCDFVPIIFAVSFFLKNEHIAKAAINIGLVPQWLFIVGIFYKLVFDISVLGAFTDSLPMETFYLSTGVLVHLSTSVALYLVHAEKPSKKTLYYSLSLLAIIYIGTLAFTPSDGYVNYVYSLGNLLPVTIPYYTYLWIPLAFVVVVLPTHGLQYLFYRLHKNKK